MSGRKGQKLKVSGGTTWHELCTFGGIFNDDLPADTLWCRYFNSCDHDRFAIFQLEFLGLQAEADERKTRVSWHEKTSCLIAKVGHGFAQC